MKNLIISILLIGILLLAACSANVHIIGKGPQKNEVVTARQWYVLYGLVPINHVDTQQMAGGAKDYEIKTEQSFLDILINYFTSIATVTSRTVTVTK